MERVNPQKGPGRPVRFKNGHSNRTNRLMGTRKESSKGIPVVTVNAKRIWDLGYGISDFGLVILGMGVFIVFVEFIVFIVGKEKVYGET
jgi:hypothetical protein